MTTAAKIQQTTPLLAYLLRGLWRRVDWRSIQQSRQRNISTELGEALVPLAVSQRSTLAFIREFAARFEIALAGGAYESRGEERVSGPAYVLLPERFAPEALPRMEHGLARDGLVCLRWDIAVLGIDFQALRMALNDGAPFFATFATAEPAAGEEALFVSALHGASASPWTSTLPGRLITPRAHRARWTAVSPISHGADTKSGNVTLFRRERSVSPVTGEQSLRPFIAGNAVRGMWRDLLFARLLALVGLKTGDLPPKRAHALFAGGSIEKGADGQHVEVAMRRRARALCPAWDLIAGCIDEQIMRGLLRVHDVTLVCRENDWLLYEQLAPATMESRPSFADFSASLPLADDLTQLRLSTRMAHRDIPEADGSQMIFNTEVLLPGTTLLHSFQLHGIDGVSDLAKSCMADLLAEFRDDGVVGAKTSAAMGRIAFDPYAPGEGEPALPSPELYTAWVAEHRDEIRGWLLGQSGPVAGDDAGEPAAPAKQARKGRGKANAAPQDAGF